MEFRNRHRGIILILLINMYLHVNGDICCQGEGEKCCQKKEQDHIIPKKKEEKFAFYKNKKNKILVHDRVDSDEKNIENYLKEIYKDITSKANQEHQEEHQEEQVEDQGNEVEDQNNNEEGGEGEEQVEEQGEEGEEQVEQEQYNEEDQEQDNDEGEEQYNDQEQCEVLKDFKYQNCNIHVYYNPKNMETIYLSVYEGGDNGIYHTFINLETFNIGIEGKKIGRYSSKI